MEPRQITDRYFVSPQIDPEDIAAIRDAGFTRVICNRPDAEVPPSHQAAAIGAAAEAVGLDFEVLPLTHQTMTPENVAAQATLVADAPGKVLAYCASGTRCTVIWALSRAGEEPVDDILSKAAAGGYDLGGLRPTLEAMAAQSKS
ncbi:Beta-lactamase hydrolase-like protein [Roseivivax sp. THAF40]|uniref:TIGR01244 family sulfur transferase n=1 Tax=unclassified Roseivivax TaxID=2639302 RepID=UPI001267A9C7|nr:MULTISPECIES: TIGR01244 family sulfur transferase [unclassified Roseivivax]QFS83800.1 Beta-lactamase hydrolase-like protein [Roseivivax sp. THAF197b]QFT47632.1 Beta-lactamase hydrolase-like protein [Roseivivax sp. THAF40]